MRAGDLVIGIPSGILTVWFKREFVSVLGFCLLNLQLLLSHHRWGP